MYIALVYNIVKSYSSVEKDSSTEKMLRSFPLPELSSK